jgi:hypothetical protein
MGGTRAGSATARNPGGAGGLGGGDGRSVGVSALFLTPGGGSWFLLGHRLNEPGGSVPMPGDGDVVVRAG